MPNRRRGISLIEVLMAIFIISVGILGVAALLPLAHLLADRGTTADRASLAGKAAIAQVKILGMNNPNYWLKSDGTYLVNDTGSNAVHRSPLDPSGAKRFCIDPRGVARGITSNFPNGTSSPAGMPRLTLVQAPDSSTAMGIRMADELFELKDDLAFVVDDANPTAPPAQSLYGGTEKRFSDARFSWLATFVREAGTDRYTVSAVVLEGRGNGMAATDEVPITVTFASTLGGGEVTLSAAPATLGKGHWIMVYSGDLYQWYRLIAFDRNSLKATLAGRDWTGPASAQGLVMPNVVGVYERTMRLEVSNIY